ncbi:hypothetical protein B0H19DRAFT_1069082 [Mycena capillaripes]|nr:hypothetical protein B0H19DRAFT_1069082 [Mycena capillaripes]
MKSQGVLRDVAKGWVSNPAGIPLHTSVLPNGLALIPPPHVVAAAMPAVVLTPVAAMRDAEKPRHLDFRILRWHADICRGVIDPADVRSDQPTSDKLRQMSACVVELARLPMKRTKLGHINSCDKDTKCTKLNYTRTEVPLTDERSATNGEGEGIFGTQDGRVRWGTVKGINFDEGYSKPPELIGM